MSLRQKIIQDKYKVLHKISEGGMGSVYKVRHMLLEQDFVIKVIRSQHQEDRELQERFRLEAKASIRLGHPNIAQLHDFFIDDADNANIVMEFIEGATLKEILAEKGPPPLSVTMEVAVQGLQALGFLHDRGYIHRDVSPDNLMLTFDLEKKLLVKLIDLGLAKKLASTDDLTTTGMFLGKVRYSAPEQFQGKKLDPRSDLYSFGVMLYQLLTGKCPIPGQQFQALALGHLSTPPLDFAVTDPYGRVPDRLRQIVLRTLAKKPEDRVSSADELVTLLEPFRQPGGIDADELSRTIELNSRKETTEAEEPTPLMPRPDVSDLTREESVALVERHIQNRELTEATSMLEETEREHGIDENTQHLRAQLEELQRKELEERMNALLEKARRHIATQDQEGALEILLEAKEIDKDNISAQTLLAQVQTEVDRKRAAGPKKKMLIWGLATVGGILLAAVGTWAVLRMKPQTAVTSLDPSLESIPTEISAGQRSFDRGLDALRERNWIVADQHFNEAIEANPDERVGYLPHYYLGLLHYEAASNCDVAMGYWEESEHQGAIQETPEYLNLDNLRRECTETVLFALKAVERAETAIENQEWKDASQHLKQAIQSNPVENADGPYLPYYLLGLVHHQYTNDCLRAEEQWQISESHSAIQKTSYYKDLESFRELCVEDLRRDTQRVREILEFNGARIAKLEDPKFKKLWKDFPTRAQQVVEFSTERDELRERLQTAERRQSSNEIIELEDDVTQFKEALDLFLEEILEPQAGFQDSTRD